MAVSDGKYFVTFYAARAALVSAVSVLLVFCMIRNLILASGMIPGADMTADSRAESLRDIAARRNTLEGEFLDRNGAAITEAEEPGKPARLLFDESYSYLIGYNSNIYETSGLRKRLYHELFYGGADGKGASVKLTTDNRLQEFCYRDILGKHEGSVIVMDAKTGELLACASRSSASVAFRANEIDEKFPEYSQIDAFFMNRAAFNQDPPGSTFKIITAASMIENNLEDYIYHDENGVFSVGDTNIRNFGGAVYNQDINMEFALNRSVNVYFAAAALKLKGGNLQDTARRFLFDQETRLDFAALNSNLNLSSLNNQALLAQTAFGQGKITVTPLQITMIMDAVLNDGVIMKPYLVQSITDNGKTRNYSSPEKLSKAISPRVAEKLKKYLNSNAVYYGFDEEIYGKVYAKTGTADQANGKNHIYYLIGVETDTGTYAALIDRRETGESSSALKQSAMNLIRYLRNDFIE